MNPLKNVLAVRAISFVLTLGVVISSFTPVTLVSAAQDSSANPEAAPVVAAETGAAAAVDPVIAEYESYATYDPDLNAAEKNQILVDAYAVDGKTLNMADGTTYADKTPLAGMQNIGVGSIVRVTVALKDVERLGGANLPLSYNNSVATVVEKDTWLEAPNNISMEKNGGASLLNKYIFKGTLLGASDDKSYGYDLPTGEPARPFNESNLPEITNNDADLASSNWGKVSLSVEGRNGATTYFGDGPLDGDVVGTQSVYSVYFKIISEGEPSFKLLQRSDSVTPDQLTWLRTSNIDGTGNRVLSERVPVYISHETATLKVNNSTVSYNPEEYKVVSKTDAEDAKETNENVIVGDKYGLIPRADLEGLDGLSVYRINRAKWFCPDWDGDPQPSNFLSSASFGGVLLPRLKASYKPTVMDLPTVISRDNGETHDLYISELPETEESPGVYSADVEPILYTPNGTRLTLADIAGETFGRNSNGSWYIQNIPDSIFAQDELQQLSVAFKTPDDVLNTYSETDKVKAEEFFADGTMSAYVSQDEPFGTKVVNVDGDSLVSAKDKIAYLNIQAGAWLANRVKMLSFDINYDSAIRHNYMLAEKLGDAIEARADYELGSNSLKFSVYGINIDEVKTKYDVISIPFNIDKTNADPIFTLSGGEFCSSPTIEDVLMAGDITFGDVDFVIKNGEAKGSDEIFVIEEPASREVIIGDVPAGSKATITLKETESVAEKEVEVYFVGTQDEALTPSTDEKIYVYQPGGLIYVYKLPDGYDFVKVEVVTLETDGDGKIEQPEKEISDPTVIENKKEAVITLTEVNSIPDIVGLTSGVDADELLEMLPKEVGAKIEIATDDEKLMRDVKIKVASVIKSGLGKESGWYGTVGTLPIGAYDYVGVLALDSQVGNPNNLVANVRVKVEKTNPDDLTVIQDENGGEAVIGGTSDDEPTDLEVIVTDGTDEPKIKVHVVPIGRGDNGERFSVEKQGDKVVRIPVDIDKDGNSDFSLFDSNGDGKVDDVIAPYGEKISEVLFFDSNDDAKSDQILVDIDGDAIYDYIFIDENADLTPEIIIKDDGDDTTALIGKDVDADGVIDETDSMLIEGAGGDGLNADIPKEIWVVKYGDEDPVIDIPDGFVVIDVGVIVEDPENPGEEIVIKPDPPAGEEPGDNVGLGQMIIDTVYPIADISGIYKGTTLIDLPLPNSVMVKVAIKKRDSLIYRNYNIDILENGWSGEHESEYPLPLGTYTFKGALKLQDKYYNPDNVLASVNVNVDLVKDEDHTVIQDVGSSAIVLDNIVADLNVELTLTGIKNMQSYTRKATIHFVDDANDLEAMQTVDTDGDGIDDIEIWELVPENNVYTYDPTDYPPGVAETLISARMWKTKKDSVGEDYVTPPIEIEVGRGAIFVSKIPAINISVVEGTKVRDVNRALPSSIAATVSILKNNVKTEAERAFNANAWVWQNNALNLNDTTELEPGQYIINGALDLTDTLVTNPQNLKVIANINVSEKAEQPGEIPTDDISKLRQGRVYVTLAAKTHDTITLNPAEGGTEGAGEFVYGISTQEGVLPATWQSGTGFTGLQASTTYYLYAKRLGNETYKESSPSSQLAVTTNVQPGGGGGGGGGGASPSPDVSPKPTPTSSSSGGGEPSPIPSVKPIENPDPDDKLPYLTWYEHNSYVSGRDDGSFDPQGAIKREEMSAMLFRLLTAHSVAKFDTKLTKFKDSQRRWSEESIATMQTAGIVKGYEDGTFMPDRAITRAEFATMLTRLGNSTQAVNGKTILSDMEGHWAIDSMSYVIQRGWMSGYDDGTFRPNSPVNRAEVVVTLNRLMHRNMSPEFIDALPELPTFSDVPKGHWAYYYVMSAATTVCLKNISL
ncbi:MAG: S-layer homology domain-containing protein [Clostridiales bacterium]|jgi:hypothetical protein|nr:S-layer homology domain-containing protein [Clostridiales bacterium]